MKVLECLMLAAVCTAQMAPGIPDPAAPPAGPAAAPARPAPPPVLTQAELGPAFYGHGLNNPLAIRPNPLVIQRAQQVAAARPDARVRVNADGTLELTNVYGQEYIDPFGAEIALELGEIIEQAQEAREAQFERQEQQFELALLQRQQQALQ